MQSCALWQPKNQAVLLYTFRKDDFSFTASDNINIVTVNNSAVHKSLPSFATVELVCGALISENFQEMSFEAILEKYGLQKCPGAVQVQVGRALLEEERVIANGRPAAPQVHLD